MASSLYAGTCTQLGPILWRHKLFFWELNSTRAIIQNMRNLIIPLFYAPCRQSVKTSQSTLRVTTLDIVHDPGSL